MKLTKTITLVFLLFFISSCSDDSTKKTSPTPVDPPVYTAPEITSSPTQWAGYGEPYAYVVTAVGNPAPTLTLDAVTHSLSFDSASGVLSGTAKSVLPLHVILRASNGNTPDAIQEFTITIGQPKNYKVVDLVSDTVTYADSVPDLLVDPLYKTSRIVFKKIAHGSFQMGDSGIGRDVYYSAEIPVHSVTITKDFYMSVFEASCGQWKKVMGYYPGPYEGSDTTGVLPAVSITYSAIMGSSGYIYQIESRFDEKFDLPTEAQWEYCCRAGTTTHFSFGGGETTDYDTSFVHLMLYAATTSPNLPHPSGLYPSNPWGLYDMHGNVFECIKDSPSNPYTDFYQYCVDNSIVNDPLDMSGDMEVLRGGSCYDLNYYCGSPTRYIVTGGYSMSCSGFRLISTIE